MPQDATVYVNDFKTKSTGPVRRYAWHNLRRDVVNLVVQTEVNREGRRLVETKHITIRVGSSGRLAFSSDGAGEALVQNTRSAAGQQQTR